MRRVYLSFFCLVQYISIWTLSKPKNKFESLGHRNPLQVQTVHKVSLQFQKFITEIIDDISSSELFYVLSGFQGFYNIAFQVPS